MLAEGLLGRGEEEGEEFLAKDHREDEDGDEAEDGDYETTAEFIEVLAEGHGVGACGGGMGRRWRSRGAWDADKEWVLGAGMNGW